MQNCMLMYVLKILCMYVRSYAIACIHVYFRQERFGQNTQEDSHELLRYLLYEMKKEETEVS